ncbi:MAG: diguanylate cyclase domain-containing protein [Gammaproteobacteria bacterium]
MNKLSVPSTQEPDALFDRMFRRVADHFHDLHRDPVSARIAAGGHRYVTIRASNLALGFNEVVHKVYGDSGQATSVCNSLLFDLSRSMGEGDARLLCERLELDDPMERLAAGPAHFAQSGMAVVALDEASRPVPDEDFLLLYEHLESFEADSWLKAGKRAPYAVCIMGCGYSSGWCSVAFDMPLAAVEYECRARGDASCKFLMAHAQRVREKLVAHHGEQALEQLYVPVYFGRKDEEESLRTMAFNDALTGLANRATFHAKAVEAINTADRTGERLCVMFIDLDGFKAINDTHGHEAGDEALRQTARRLESSVRGTDTVARLGGDEFAVLATSIPNMERAGLIADKLVERIGQPFDYFGHELRVGASIGIGTYLFDRSDADAVIADADEAMYEAKRAGKYQYKFSKNALAVKRNE